jgi:hypothetical protein
MADISPYNMGQVNKIAHSKPARATKSMDYAVGSKKIPVPPAYCLLFSVV